MANNVFNPFDNIKMDVKEVSARPEAVSVTPGLFNQPAEPSEIITGEILADKGEAPLATNETPIMTSNDAAESQANVFRGSAAPMTMDIVTVTAATELVESSAFNETLSKIPATANRVDSLLAEYRADPFAFIDAHDEDELDALVKEIAGINAFANGVKGKRKDIKKYFDGVRDEALSYLDQRLTDAQFDSLIDAQATIRQLKNDLAAQRINQRWSELEETFKANLPQYPLIEQVAKPLTDFSRFKLYNAQMVSGAKTKKVTKKTHTQINEIVFGWNTGLEMIVANMWGLNNTHLTSLLQEYINDPRVETINERGQALKRKEQAEIEAAEQRRILLEKQEAEEAKRREEYAKKQAELAEQAKQAELLRQQKRAQELEAERIRLENEQKQAIALEQQRRAEIERLTTQYVAPQMRESYPRVMEYIFANPQYREIHGNDQVKAAVMYDLVQQMTQSGSPVHQDTAMDATKVLSLIRFVLDI